MSVLIKGLEMPPSCNLCEFSETYVHADGEEEVVCQFTLSPMNYHKAKTRADNCPLIEIKPHGRLIDADALAEKMVKASESVNKNSFEWDLCAEVITQTANAPTIIEAEVKA